MAHPLKNRPILFLFLLLTFFALSFIAIDGVLIAFGISPFLSFVYFGTVFLVLFFIGFSKLEERLLTPRRKKRVEQYLGQLEQTDFNAEFVHEQVFAKDFQQSLKPQLLNLEAIRKMAGMSAWFRFSFWVPIILAFFAGGLFMDIYLAEGESQGAFTLVAFVIALALWFAWVRLPIYDYKQKLKKEFMQVLCSFYGDLQYSIDGKVPREFIKGLSIVPKHHSSWSKDIIEGSYKGVGLWMSRLTLRKKPHKDLSQDKARKVYQGILIRLHFPKTFMGKTVIKKDRGVLNLLGREKNLERVELEDSQFEGHFEVYGEDQQEARFLLTTRFMETLVELSKTYHSRKKKIKADKPGDLSCEFFGQSLTLSIPTKEKFFYVGSTRHSVYEHRELKRFLEQMSRLFELIDVLVGSLSRRG